jgi:hypothetical protein
VVVDLFFEEATRSGFASQVAFCQPELEAVFNKAAIDRKLPVLRGYSKSLLPARIHH